MTEVADTSRVLDWTRAVRREVGKAVVGQDQLVQRLLVAMLAGGHVLLEGLPGLAKTLVVRSLARACVCSFQRIQFTPDLLPADLVGTLVYDPRTLTFLPHKGPIFANIVLADEVNRAPAKVQSALLEAMQERSVTLGHTTHRLDDPFLVLATQNPIEHEGTFPLPEAQLDRFLFKVNVTYPSRADELEVLKSQLTDAESRVEPVATVEDLRQARQALATVFVDDAITTYVLDIVRASREPAAGGLQAIAQLVRFGASPRAGVHLLRAARATALLAERTFVLPEDVREVALDVLRHRLVLSYDAETDGVSPDEIITRILGAVTVP